MEGLMLMLTVSELDRWNKPLHYLCPLEEEITMVLPLIHVVIITIILHPPPLPFLFLQITIIHNRPATTRTTSGYIAVW